MSRRRRGCFASGKVLVLGFFASVGCAAPTTPDSRDPSGAAAPSGESTAPGRAPRVDPFEDGGLPRVNDRDPEEERRKMSLSREHSQRAQQSLGQGRLDQAVLQAREALKIHEQNVDAMLVLAEVYYKQGKYELTQTVASSALGVDSKVRTPRQESQAHNLRGFALMRMGKSQAATLSFRKAAEVDAENASAWNNLGTRYLAGGDVETATKVFAYAIELDAAFPEAHLNLGAAYRAARRWPDAEREFKKALSLRADYPDAHFNLGVLYLDADSFPGLTATQRLQRAISHLTQYRELALAAGASRGGDKARVAGRGKQAPDPVSPDRADEYIAVAKKGIAREERRLEREAKRQKGDADSKDDASDGSEPPASSTPRETSPEAKPPAPPVHRPSPAPQRPGQSRPPPSNPQGALSHAAETESIDAAAKWCRRPRTFDRSCNIGPGTEGSRGITTKNVET